MKSLFLLLFLVLAFAPGKVFSQNVTDVLPITWDHAHDNDMGYYEITEPSDSSRHSYAYAKRWLSLSLRHEYFTDPYYPEMILAYFKQAACKVTEIGMDSSAYPVIFHYFRKIARTMNIPASYDIGIMVQLRLSDDMDAKYLRGRFNESGNFDTEELTGFSIINDHVTDENGNESKPEK